MADNFRVKVAVVQAAPILFNREATVEKACRLTVEATAQGARLILFPDVFQLIVNERPTPPVTIKANGER